jgi:hypothetical protein
LEKVYQNVPKWPNIDSMYKENVLA